MVWTFGMMAGSSPRTRGTHQCRRGAAADWRFIPADAGNTSCTLTQRISSAVHPRGRGEHQAGAALVAGFDGSSPRARGTLVSDALSHVGRRFIPAGAGNTHCARIFFRIVAVHPRGRGEHTAQALYRGVPGGSSPRARGTPGSLSFVTGSLRFIPAGAGNTTPRSLMVNGVKVHPRGRGEHSRSRMHTCMPSGSSPRARGTRQNRARTGRRGRFIPAGAGNTAPWHKYPPAPSVHPRGRGEHS